jgi:dUTP pyrophosphatase
MASNDIPPSTTENTTNKSEGNCLSLDTRPELFIKIISTDPEVIKYYTEAAAKTHDSKCTDSGFDLIIINDIEHDLNTRSEWKLMTGIQCSPQFKSGYYLYPRSSIIKTPLRLANSVGIIDQGYRGEIIAAVDGLNKIHIPKYTRLFQLCHPSLQPMKVTVVSSLDVTERGTGGFGSTD